jgi:class 3 adenylate cyclase/tetratricopeptide (TPR) repeat protein
MSVCATCGEDNPERAWFCFSCGARLGSASSGERRKLATVLFCDVSGSTEMGERLDAESVRALMLRYFDEMRSAIEQHGGTVEKFIGDAVAAVFGVPFAHEDDAQRALLAAAEMHDRLSTLNDELERRFGRRLAIRIGVNTGEVVASAGTGDSPLASGDALNVAQRLEQVAKPGETLIGERTHLLTRGAAWVEPVGPLTLKGKSQEVSAYRLRSVVTGGRAFARRLDAELVGRKGELQRLQQEFDGCVTTARARLVAVIGEPGVGKSRLAAEFVRSIVGNATVLTGRCLSYGQGITYWPLAEATGQAAGIRADDTPERAQRRIEELLAGDADATQVAQLLAVAAGLTNARASPEEIAWATRRLLRALARERPIVFLLDDLQWAEATFLSLVDTLTAVDASVLLLGLARPELLERPTWSPDNEGRVVVALRPLSNVESSGLLDRVVGGALPDELRARVTEAAGGNPLFIEELFAMLIDAGVLVFADGRWLAVGDVSRIAVPLTLEALLSSRLDLVDEAQRAVMECASIEGKTFRRETVEALSSASRREGVGSALHALIEKELVRPILSEGDGVFGFHHLLIRDVVYRSIPKRRRAELHEAFARLLEHAAQRPPAGLEEITAYHLEQACRYRRELGPPDEADIALAKTAASLLESAALKALSRGDLFAAINLLRRAVSIVSKDGPERAEMLPELGAALAEAGKLSEADGVLAEALTNAGRRGNERLRARARVEQLVLRLQVDVRGAMSEARAVADNARYVFEKDGDELGLCRVSYLEALVYWFRGRSASAERAWARAAAHARRLGDERRLWDILRWLPSAALFGPTPATEGIRRCEEIRERLRGNKRAQAEIIPALAGLYAMTGRFELAGQLVDESEALLDELGFTIHSVPEWAAFVSMLAGDPAEAERRLRSGYERLAEMGEIAILSTTAALLARTLREQGNNDEALLLTRESENLAAPEDVVTQIVWRGVRARIFAGQGRLGEAEALAREAVTLAEKTDFLSDHGDSLLDLADVLRLGNRLAETGIASRRALALYVRKGNLVAVEKARSLLAGLTPV